MIRLMGWILDKGWEWMARKIIPIDDNLYDASDEED